MEADDVTRKQEKRLALTLSELPCRPGDRVSIHEAKSMKLDLPREEVPPISDDRLIVLASIDI